MLRRQVSGGFVCLRCRLQQASTPTRTGVPLFRPVALKHPIPISRRLYSTSLAQDSRNPTSSASNSAENSPEVEDKLYDPIGSALGGNAANSFATPRIPKEELTSRVHEDEPASAAAVPELGEDNPYDPHSGVPRFNSTLLSSLKIYKSRGAAVAAENEDLVVHILGEPASALVMRGRGQWKKRAKLQRMEASVVAGKSESLIQHLEREASDLGSQEILDNIHELRPSEGRIPHSEFSALVETLDKGFTTQQLAAYMANFYESDFEDPFPVRLAHDPDWILERQPWIPGVENPDPRLEPILYGYLTKGMSPKRKLAVQVMRQCWGVSTYEVLHHEGYLSVKFREEEFGLLMLGQKRWLADIARNLHPGTQLVVSPAIDTISILAPQKAAELILAEINKKLQQQMTVDFDASILSASAVDPAVLKEVGRITNTVVRLSPSGDKLLITWIHLPDRPTEFENLGDVVLRYLNYAADTGPRSSGTLAVIPEDGGLAGRYVVEQGCEQKMSWIERLQKWARWVKPCPEEPLLQADKKAFNIPATLLPQPLQGELFANDGETKVENDLRLRPTWSLSKTQTGATSGHGEPKERSSLKSAPTWSAVKTETRAAFGHILHVLDPGSPFRLVSPTMDFDSSLRRTFLQVSPPLQSLDFPSNLHATGLYHSIIIMRFVPAPTQTTTAPVFAASAPPLELRIEVDHREVKKLMSLRAVLGTHNGDVMLPSYPVDVRLHQTQYVDVDGRYIQDVAASVIDFLGLSDIRPWEGKLENPPRLDAIPIPNRFLLDGNKTRAEQQDSRYPYGIPEFEGEGTGKKVSQEDSVQIDYLFASREIQRIVSAEHKGYKISFLNVDAGQRGGQTNQLVLDAIPVILSADRGRPPKVPKFGRTEHFLNVVSELASGDIGFKWQGQSLERFTEHL